MDDAVAFAAAFAVEEVDVENAVVSGASEKIDDALWKQAVAVADETDLKEELHLLNRALLAAVDYVAAVVLAAEAASLEMVAKSHPHLQMPWGVCLLNAAAHLNLCFSPAAGVACGRTLKEKRVAASSEMGCGAMVPVAGSAEAAACCEILHLPTCAACPQCPSVCFLPQHRLQLFRLSNSHSKLETSRAPPREKQSQRFPDTNK